MCLLTFKQIVSWLIEQDNVIRCKGELKWILLISWNGLRQPCIQLCNICVFHQVRNQLGTSGGGKKLSKRDPNF